MKLAFYYHIPVATTNSVLNVPGYLGVFIDALAKEVETLYLVMHEASDDQLKEADYSIKSENIVWINLGVATPAWHRHLFHKKILKGKLNEIESCDCFLVRSPTPLAPFFSRYLKNAKVIFMIVGDYLEGAEHLLSSTFRDRIIYFYLYAYDRIFTKKIKSSSIVVNSLSLYEKYKFIAKSITPIKTTTLSQSDFYSRYDTCNKSIIELLYTGRIDPAKGLFELVESIQLLRNKSINIRLNIVGWEESESSPVKTSLISLAESLGVKDFIVFHGRKKVGPELLSYYRNADIYVIPSYHEGFPRTIWEAMASALPVVATAVGGIPKELTNFENALLIEPKDKYAIATAVERLIFDKSLRQKLINNALELASHNTLEKQTGILVSSISASLQKDA